MLKNYLVVAWRTLKRQKGHSFINITGLAIGFICCLMIFLFVQDELSYDRFHEKASQIFRVTTEGRIADREFNIAMSSPPLAKALKDEFPQVLQTVRLFRPWDRILVRCKDKKFNEKRFFYADSTIFDIFTIPLVHGDSRTALSQSHSLVITRTAAQKYFGSENPLGHTLSVDDKIDFQITGVAEDAPLNSHFHFDFLASLTTIHLSRDLNWFNGCLYTYALLQEDGSYHQLESELPAFVQKYMGPQVQNVMGFSIEDFFKLGNSFAFNLQPITDIHLHSNLDYELEANSDVRYVYIFSAIAFFILFIASVNFINLSTARSSTRANEVGVRKVLGSNRSQLVRQFLSESVLLSLLSLLLAAVFLELFLPFFNNLIGKNLSVHFGNWLILPAIIGMTLLFGIIAGSYPAFFLASFQPISTLKGKPGPGGRSAGIRYGLVVFQFAISITLLVVTFVVYEQLEYIRYKKLGFDKDHVVVIQRASALKQQSQAFKQALSQYPSIISTALSNYLPGNDFDINGYRSGESPEGELQPLNQWFADHDFARTLQLEMAAGRFFSSDSTKDSSSIVINQSAARMLGMTEPLGKHLQTVIKGNELNLTIIGVLKDFHYESLHKEIRPLVIRNLLNANGDYISIRLGPDNLSKTLALLEKKWEEFTPDQPFEYFFLDDSFDKLYRSEQRAGQLFTAFSIIAGLIACLGLLGLAAFSTEQRTKEVGIRKVLGASVPSIIVLLTKGFTKWMLVANLIAWPVAYYVMDRWLHNFAYRTSIELWIFPASALLTLGIALVTVSFLAVRAAFANPVEALRYE